MSYEQYKIALQSNMTTQSYPSWLNSQCGEKFKEGMSLSDELWLMFTTEYKDFYQGCLQYKGDALKYGIKGFVQYLLNHNTKLKSKLIEETFPDGCDLLTKYNIDISDVLVCKVKQLFLIHLEYGKLDGTEKLNDKQNELKQFRNSSEELWGELIGEEYVDKSGIFIDRRL